MNNSATIEAAYVLDTVTLIRHLTHHKKLGEKAKTIIEAAEKGETQLILSAVSIAELYYSNVKNGWLSDFEQFYENLKSKPYFRLVPFDADDVLDFEQDAAVPEMHDRIIAGLARRLSVPLLTNDPLIVQSGLVEVEW